jgi:hypothetical protein
MEQQFLPISTGEFSRKFLDHPLFELNPQSFCLEIEKVVREQKLDYLEATAFLCDHYEINYSEAAGLLTETMRDKIEVDSMAKNRFRKANKPTESIPEEGQFFVDILGEEE